MVVVAVTVGSHSAPSGHLGAEQALIVVIALSAVNPFKYLAFTFTL